MDEIISQNLNIPKEVQDKFKELKGKLEKFKKDLLKKFDKYVAGIALLPPEVIDPEDAKFIPKEELDKRQSSIRILVVVDDSDSKKISKFELKDNLKLIIDKSALAIDPNLLPQVMLSSDIVENCYDAKYDILKTIGMSVVLYDPTDLLAAIRISEVHKSMTIKKFQRYILSYVAAGSLFRGEKSNDIDVYIVVDDTDVKRMSRYELKEKLRSIIVNMGFQAAEITGVKKQFHIQVYILTDFWENVKDASPVIYTFLRDGVPLYDRGVFMPWKLLLKMGRIKPSPEAIDFHMDVGEKLIKRIKNKLLSVVTEDLFYATLNPAQATLMLYGIPPPTPKESIKLMEDIFVKKEKLLEMKYVKILENMYNTFKAIEHYKLKEIKGKEIDKLIIDVEDYLKRINKLFKTIEKRSEGRRVVDFYDACMTIVKDVLNFECVNNKDYVNGLGKLVKDGKVPQRFLGIFKSVVKAKKEYDSKKISKQEIEKVRKQSTIFIQAMIEYLQRKKWFDLDKMKLHIQHSGKKYADVYFLEKNVYIVPDLNVKPRIYQKAVLIKNDSIGEIKKIKLEEFEKALVSVTKIKPIDLTGNLMDHLKRLFGDDMIILL